jgi:hypothetical protein
VLLASQVGVFRLTELIAMERFEPFDRIQNPFDSGIQDPFGSMKAPFDDETYFSPAYPPQPNSMSIAPLNPIRKRTKH